MTPGSHGVVIIGAGAPGRRMATQLLDAGITDFVILDNGSEVAAPALDAHLRPGREVISSVFDDSADAWTLKTGSGELWRGDVVVAAHRAQFAPWIPNIAGHNAFRGTAFHAAGWDQDFDPVGKRIAVIGADATAGQYLDPRAGRLISSAASVTVFAHPPRRVVAEVPLPTTRVKRWLRRQLPGVPPVQPRPTAELAKSAIDTMTSSGIRTRDGVDHRVDAVIYGTGFTIPAHVSDKLVGAGGLTIRQAWHDGMEPYLGVAIHGFPNYFVTTGPDFDAQTRYVVQCLRVMQSTGSTRIQLRRSTQHVYNERVYLTRPRQNTVQSAFELSSRSSTNDVYDGPATLTIAGSCRRVRVRLAGHLDPIDGQYHWQGTVFECLPDEVLRQARAVTLQVAERNVPARISEQTPWGTCSIAGVGAPPFVLRAVTAVGGAPATRR